MYPVAINNHVTRVTALLLFALSIVCAAFFDRESWVPYLSAFITADCLGRFLGGPSLSSISMLSRLLTIHEPPYYMPGPAKQIDSFITLLISVFSTGFFFAKFDDHYAWACAGMVILAMISAVEGLGNFSLGPILIELGIYTAIFDDAIYRIYNATLLETVETYNYIVDRSHKPPRPKRITTDRNNPIALRYKRKSEEWTKYDFDPIRHMKIQYFYCPLSIAGLAWAFRRSSYNDLDINSGRPDPRTHTVDHTWFEVLAPIAAFVFIFMMFMYITKVSCSRRHPGLFLHKPGILEIDPSSHLFCNCRPCCSFARFARSGMMSWTLRALLLLRYCLCSLVYFAGTHPSFPIIRLKLIKHLKSLAGFSGGLVVYVTPYLQSSQLAIGFVNNLILNTYTRIG